MVDCTVGWSRETADSEKAGDTEPLRTRTATTMVVSQLTEQLIRDQH